MAPAMPCKRASKCLQSRKLHPRKLRTRFMVVQWNPMHPQGNELNLLNPKIMKTTLQAKEILWWHITIWRTSLFRCHKRWNFRMWKQQWIMEKARDDPSMEIGESHEQEGGVSRSTKRQKESPLCHIDGFMSSREFGVGTRITKDTKPESCSVVTS